MKRSIDERPGDRVIGHIGGTAKVEVPMPATEITRGGEHNPADIYANYVREQVQHMMDSFGSVPTQITVQFKYNEEE